MKNMDLWKELAEKIAPGIGTGIGTGIGSGLSIRFIPIVKQSVQSVSGILKRDKEKQENLIKQREEEREIQLIKLQSEANQQKLYETIGLNCTVIIFVLFFLRATILPSSVKLDVSILIVDSLAYVNNEASSRKKKNETKTLKKKNETK